MLSEKKSCICAAWYLNDDISHSVFFAFRCHFDW